MSDGVGYCTKWRSAAYLSDDSQFRPGVCCIFLFVIVESRDLR